ncbi:hypothetical protein SELMODRAFT_431595 [Selaginella moellendorffii]|uniref:Uncharacterized protein n=1 Tax=Selaginella moellendorffii TaxID=88036 RepID=D8TD57_SELML|nr:hypothetical protein SELMODRAFT_431595 [Selaginella moellendorffii]
MVIEADFIFGLYARRVSWKSHTASPFGLVTPRTPMKQISLEVEAGCDFTKDGSVDVFGNPARRSSTGGWKSAKFVLGYQVLGTITYFGVATNLVLYLMKSLNLSNGAAANAATNWVGTSYATALIGAFIGDAYLGRYWASVLFVAIHFLGTLLLTVQSALPSFRSLCSSGDVSKCPPASAGKRTFLYTALYISALGAGGHQPCMFALGADQFEDGYPPESRNKSSFFSYFLVASLLGSLFVTVILSYVEVNHSYAIGYGISTLAIGLAGLTFIAGITSYRHFRPGGNPFRRAIQVVVAAVRKWEVPVPTDSSLLHEASSSDTVGRRIFHSNRLSFLDKAATRTEQDHGGEVSRWKLCTVTQVEEVKCIVLMVPLWISSCIYQMVEAQVTTTFVEQGACMDNKFGLLHLSPASLYTFYTLAVIAATVLYEKLLVPSLRKVTGNQRGITILQRMGIGNVILIVAMMVAAGVERKRLQVVREHHLAADAVSTVPMTIFWQVPQYVLSGLAEVFTYVAQTEFFYDQAPDGVRGIGSALSMASVAVGNYLSTLTVTVLNDVTQQGEWLPRNLNQGRLDLFFWVMAGISVLNFGYFLICAVTYRYINVEKSAE